MPKYLMKALREEGKNVKKTKHFIFTCTNNTLDDCERVREHLNANTFVDDNDDDDDDGDDDVDDNNNKRTQCDCR